MDKRLYMTTNELLSLKYFVMLERLQAAHRRKKLFTGLLILAGILFGWIIAQTIHATRNPSHTIQPVASPPTEYHPHIQVMPPTIQKAQKINAWYHPHISMSKADQKYLYNLCQKRNLDYNKTLALIYHESRFDPNSISDTNDYGYFQINAMNFSTLANKLHTANAPLNHAVNIDWGTYTLASLYHYWREQGYFGQALDEAVWSSYNEGITGFHKYGIESHYVHGMFQAISYVQRREAE